MPDAHPIRISFGLVNAYLLHGERGDILIDTGLPGCSRRLQRALHRDGSSLDQLALIILTHVHLDHVGNLAAILRQASIPVLVHQLEAPILQEGRVLLPAGGTQWLVTSAKMAGPLAWVPDGLPRLWPTSQQHCGQAGSA